MTRCNRVLLGVLLAAGFLLPACGDKSNAKPAKADAKTPPAATADGGGAKGAPQTPAATGDQQEWKKAATDAIARGVKHLQGAAKDGKWGVQDKPDLGVSALVARAVLNAPGRKADDVRATLDWLAANQKDDGGIYENANAVYITAAAMLAMGAAKDGKYDLVVKKGMDYLRVVQADEADGRTPSSEDYGGIGYGSKGDVNLSTTHWAVEAVSEAGLAKNDDFYKKALNFLQNSQNRSESNKTTHTLEDGTKVESGNDGGGIYRPAESKAGVQKLSDGRTVFRSYGSMTYALLKSYLLCDLDAKDGRVKAALEWIGKNWVLDYNPGMEHAKASGDKDPRYQGLYYYYLTLARTLSAAERKGIDLAAGGIKDWRGQLASKMVSLQQQNGTWVNTHDRWFEGSPELVTAYAVLALEECLAGAR